MKKILFILLTIFLFSNVVRAENLSLENINNWQEEKLEGDNILVEYRYRFYREKKIGEYVRVDSVSNYKYEDKNDRKYGSYSDYSSECNPMSYHQVNYKKLYHYQHLLPINYIKIENTSLENLKINQLIVYNANSKLDYLLYDWDKYDSLLNVINPGGYIIISNPFEVYLSRFRINLELYNSKLKYKITLSNDNSFDSSKIVASINANSDRVIYEYDDSFVLYENYTEPTSSFSVAVNDFINIISVENVCRMREVYTYRYNIEKEYYDDNYYKDINELVNLDEDEKLEYKKDEYDYKIFYRYNENIIEDKEDFNNNIDVTNYEFLESNIKLVKTGVDRNLDYNYLILYVLVLILVALILIKKIKKNVD